MLWRDLRSNVIEVIHMGQVIDVSMFGDALTVGTVGYIAGVVFPLAFRLIGYVVDSVKVVLKG